MKTLRDKKDITKFLILYHAANERPTKLADISSQLDMTEQGVSNYVSEMEEEGLMDSKEKKYRPTSKGMELVRNILGEMNEFLDEANTRLEFISSCVAIADEHIEKNDEVGLFMKDGFLYASLKESSSMGTALMDAKPGYPLEIGGLEGITDMDLGSIYLLVAEIDEEQEKSAHKIEKKLEQIDYDLIAVMRETQYGLTNILESKPDILFGPVASTINAAEKGLNVALLLSTSDVERVIERLRNRNKNMDEKYRIKYELV
ncbi:MAG: winged helix-turn-helix domain-containing protein [Thermoplasmatota archaeon]